MIIETPATLPEGKIKRIHIDQHRNAANKSDGGDRPVYTVQYDGNPYKAHEVEVLGPATFIGNGRQLSCGAIHYLETTAEVRTVIRAAEEAAA